MQQAVYAYQNVLEIFTISAFPMLWVGTPQNLARVYEAEAGWMSAYKCYEWLFEPRSVESVLASEC